MYTENDPNDLKNVGLKATFPRLKILDIFRKSGARHLSAEDVYRALIGESIDIGLATVYRVLTQFEQPAFWREASSTAARRFLSSMMGIITII